MNLAMLTLAAATQATIAVLQLMSTISLTKSLFSWINLKDAYINAEVICSKNEKTTFFGFYYFKRRSKTKTR